MSITELLQKKNMTKRQLSIRSGVPYSTLQDICTGKTSLKKCSGETLYNIAKALDVSIESLLASSCEERIPFGLFKSNVCHEVKRKGEIPYMIDLLQENRIRMYYDRVWHLEALYLLGMLDYLSRKNDIPECTDYDDLRCCRFKEPVYPSGIIIRAAAAHDDSIKQEALRTAIPEFLRFNIVENEVENVV
ncbi:MAG: helix-turn-helix domain-containing protein [Lachnospiraceae bacterium]|nr:helix-turn-helix domain-containing protein [Lachnospiraceae bacterium]